MNLWYLRVLELVSDFTQDLGEEWRMLLCGLSTWWLCVVKSSQCIGGYIDPAKLLGEKERGNVKCLFSLFWEERREEKAVDCILVPASLAHQNQESSAWLLMRSKMDRCHTQGIVGRTDLKTKQKNKKKLQKAKKKVSSGPRLWRFYPHKGPTCQCKSGNWTRNYPIFTHQWGVFLQEIRVHLKLWPQARKPHAFVNS